MAVSSGFYYTLLEVTYVDGRVDNALGSTGIGSVGADLAGLSQRAVKPHGKAARLPPIRRFQKLAHPGSPIPEHDIGVAVFERRQGYDTATDNIVRVSAGDLRRRLEHYFLDQGRQEELICEMPRGGYVLTFDPQKRVLIIEGNDSQATLAAGELHHICLWQRRPSQTGLAGPLCPITWKCCFDRTN